MKNKFVYIIFSFIFIGCLSEDNHNKYVSTKKIISTIETSSEINSSKNTIWTFIYDQNQFIKSILKDNKLAYQYEYSIYQINKILDFSDINHPKEIKVDYSSDPTKNTITLLETENKVFTKRQELYFNGLKLLETEKICTNQIACDSTKFIKYSYLQFNQIQIMDSINLIKKEFTFDSQNNPLKNNFTNFRLLNKDLIYPFYNSNNIIQEKIFNSTIDTNPSEIINYIITYDSDHFPTSIIGKRESDGKIWISYKFNYL